MSKQGQITLDIQITESSALQLVPLLIVNKYSKFQMDTFDSFWEMDADKKLTRPRCWCRRRNDNNSSTFFLRKVELKTNFIQISIIIFFVPLVNMVNLMDMHIFIIITCSSCILKDGHNVLHQIGFGCYGV